MKNVIAVAFLLLLVTACNKEPSNQAPAPAAAQKLEVFTPSDEEVANKGKTLDRDLEFDFAHQVRYNRTRSKGDGTVEHQVLVEVLEDDPAAVKPKLEAFLESRGYNKRRELADRGGTRLVFAKKKAPNLDARIWPPGSGPVVLEAPKAKGSIYLSWKDKPSP